jgi:hypothetical protein
VTTNDSEQRVGKLDTIVQYIRGSTRMEPEGESAGALGSHCNI